MRTCWLEYGFHFVESAGPINHQWNNIQRCWSTHNRMTNRGLFWRDPSSKGQNWSLHLVMFRHKKLRHSGKDYGFSEITKIYDDPSLQVKLLPSFLGHIIFAMSPRGLCRLTVNIRPFWGTCWNDWEDSLAFVAQLINRLHSVFDMFLTVLLFISYKQYARRTSWKASGLSSLHGKRMDCPDETKQTKREL